MKKLGIIGAMTVEVETLRDQLRALQTSEYAGMTFYTGVLNELPVVVVQCGVGKVNAAMCVQILCDRFAVTHIVNTGIAGSLCADLDIGDLVISRDAMYHDFSCTVFGYAEGQVPGMPQTFPADEALMALAWEAADSVNPGHCRFGRIASGDQFVSGGAEKQRIIDLTGALCTEMEGAAIAQAAYRNGIPFVILRAISDKADDSAQMDYPTFEKIAAHRCAEVAARLAQKLLEV